jgi:hypothetical protein
VNNLLRHFALSDRDSANDQFIDVVITEDPYTGDEVYTVFAWGHPTLKIVLTAVKGTMLRFDWTWLGLDYGTEPNLLTRARDVAANFCKEIGAFTPHEPEADWVNAFEEFTRALGSNAIFYEGDTAEGHTFAQLMEHLGEHELDAWVDRVVHI